MSARPRVPRCAASNPLLRLLTTCQFDDPEFREAIAAWPARRQLWSYLDTRGARENFARFIVARDDANGVSYDDRITRCMSAAAQFYARYSAFARLDDGALAHLQSVDAYVGSTPRMLRAPVYMALNASQAFNAFLVDASPRSLDGYMLLEPQTGDFIAPGDPRWRRYVQGEGLVLYTLDDFTENLHYELSARHSFVRDRRGEMVHVPSEQVVKLARDFAIADSGETNFEHYVTRRGFDLAGYIRHQLRCVWRLDDEQLLALGRALIGQRFRARPGGPSSTLTPESYVSLIGREHLLPALTRERAAPPARG